MFEVWRTDVPGRSPRAKRNASVIAGTGTTLEPRRTREVKCARLRSRAASSKSLVTEVRECACSAGAITGAIIVVVAGEHATGTIEEADVDIVLAAAERSRELLLASSFAAEMTRGATALLALATATIVHAARLASAVWRAAGAIVLVAYVPGVAADALATGIAIRAETAVVETEMPVVTIGRATSPQPAALIVHHAAIMAVRTGR